MHQSSNQYLPFYDRKITKIYMKNLRYLSNYHNKVKIAQTYND